MGSICLGVVAAFALIYVCWYLICRAETEKNYKMNRLAEAEESYIYDQNGKWPSAFRYGFFSFAFNGCEVAAVYNLLVSQGRRADLADLIRKAQKNGLMLLGGLFGSNVYRIGRLLEAQGISFKKISGRKETRLFQNAADTKEGKYIICFWNPNRPFQGIHTVFAEKKNGTVQYYNYGGRRKTEDGALIPYTDSGRTMVVYEVLNENV